jgi:hypothetical protein
MFFRGEEGLLPGSVRRQMEMKAPPRPSQPAGQGNEASADGLGGEQGLLQAQPSDPPGEVVGDQ